ncbi:MAG: peptide ABC transporter substrate-binding protein, partial [Anaerolineales bacterium]|nr:peptide ABC transporter substrate-binding protein [Anaerolineales bacterium]
MLLEAPVGTGPYRVVEWARGESITYEAFEDYWGDAPFAQTVILRWNQKSSVRLLELQSGSVHMITAINPDDFATVDNDPALVRIPIPNPNILYIGFTNTLAPFDDNAVRQAVAMGIDRSRIVDNFYPPGSEVASHFTPCSIPNGCAGEEWYAFDIDAANAILDDAGFPRGDDGVRFSTAIYYRDIFRGYLPEPRAVAVELQTQLLDNLGIDAEVVVMESGEFIAASTGGQLDGIYLLGWGADYPHVTNFLDFHFNANNPQFGETFPAIYEALEAASQIADPA